MPINLDSLASSAALYPFALDLARERVFVTPMDEAAYRTASFLDERLKPRGEWVDAAPVARAMAGARDVRPLHFIFHAGHVGSTLLSILLGEAGRVLALREPLALRNLADAHDAGDARADALLELFLKLWERGFNDTGCVILKATSTTERLAAKLLAARPDARAVMLNVTAETYLATMLAGENSAADLNALGPERLHRLGRMLGAAPPRPGNLGELIAMSWAAERLTQVSTMREMGARILWIDFDTMLGSLVDTLARVLAHFGLPAEAAERISASAALSRYSKAPEHAYSASLRRDLLDQARRDFGPQIREALGWLDGLKNAHPAAGAVL
jgi:hypothetical protein